MLSKDSLKLLIPLDLGPISDVHCQVIGNQLDKIISQIEALKLEMIPWTATTTIPDWETRYGIINDDTKPLEARRNAVVAAIRAQGGLSKQYFLDLADNLGYSITIQEMSPLRVPFHVGARVYSPEEIFVWELTVDASLQHVYHFRAGSRVGQRLVWKDADNSLESIFERLKPAWTMIKWKYESRGIGDSAIGDDGIG